MAVLAKAPPPAAPPPPSPIKDQYPNPAQAAPPPLPPFPPSPTRLFPSRRFANAGPGPPARACVCVRLRACVRAFVRASALAHDAGGGRAKRARRGTMYMLHYLLNIMHNDNFWGVWAQDLAALHGYIPFLIELFLQLFPPAEARRTAFEVGDD